MAADYPGAIKNFLTLEDGVDTVLAQHMNERGDEITAVETELGADVAGSAADLVTRLAVVLADAGTLKADSVITTTLKTATVEVSGLGNHELTGSGSYGFYPQIKGTVNTAIMHVGTVNEGASYKTMMSFDNGLSYGQQRYVTASGVDWWIWILTDKETNEIIRCNSSKDHPSFGKGGVPEEHPHPFSDYDEANHDIVLLDKDTCLKLEQESRDVGKSILTLINEDYKVDMTKEYTYEPLHSSKFLGKKPVMIEKIPDYVKVRKLKRRVS